MSNKSDAWDPEIAKRIRVAVDNRDLATMRELLQQHPQHLLFRGNDIWLSTGIVAGCWLEGVKALVELGLDINASPNYGKGTDLHIPEGTVFDAVANNCEALTLWMLEHGARLNFEVDGKRRCLPLLSAVRNGNLSLVKILVEHGADIHAVWGDGNATTLSESIERFDIRDFLVSRGVVDLRDTTPPDFPMAHSMIDEQFAQSYEGVGEPFFEIANLTPTVVVMLITNTVPGKQKVAYTKGVSDINFPNGRRKYFCTELVISLPSELDQQSPIFKWAMDELSRLARTLVAQQTWFPDHVVVAQPTAECPFSNWLVLPLDIGVGAPDYRIVRTHELIPLFSEEAKALSERGVDGNIRKQLDELRPVFLQRNRKNMEME